MNLNHCLDRSRHYLNWVPPPTGPPATAPAPPTPFAGPPAAPQPPPRYTRYSGILQLLPPEPTPPDRGALRHAVRRQNQPRLPPAPLSPSVSAAGRAAATRTAQARRLICYCRAWRSPEPQAPDLPSKESVAPGHAPQPGPYPQVPASFIGLRPFFSCDNISSANIPPIGAGRRPCCRPFLQELPLCRNSTEATSLSAA